MYIIYYYIDISIILLEENTIQCLVIDYINKIMISDEISAGKVPEISIMIILLYFDEFIYLLLGALEIFLFQIRLDISSLIYRYLL